MLESTGPARAREASGNQAGLAWILIILSAALALRCFHLAKESLWLDEFASWWFASGDLQRALHSEATNPPLYYALLHYWIYWFGASEAALRSLSIIPSVASVWLIYRLATVLFSRYIAILSSVYQALSTFQIFYAQEARTFSFLVFFILLSSLMLWQALESERLRRLYYAGYALAMSLALYSHFIAVFFFAAQGIFVLVRKPKRMFSYAVSAACAFAVFLPWLLALLKASGSGQAGRRYFWLKLPQAYFSFLFGDSLVSLDERAVTHLRDSLGEDLPILFAAVTSIAVLLVFAWIARKRWGDGLLYAVTMCTVPVLLSFVVSFKIMVFDERYLIPASPFVYLVVSSAIGEIVPSPNGRRFDFRGRQWIGLAATGAFVILLTISMSHYYFGERFGKEQWREAVADMEAAGSPHDFIVFDPDYLHHGYDYYQKRGWPYVAVTDSMDTELLASPTRILDLLHAHERIWFLGAHYDNGGILSAMQTLYPLQSHREYPKGHGIEVFEFRTGVR